jgi:hypothetical protein
MEQKILKIVLIQLKLTAGIVLGFLLLMLVLSFNTGKVAEDLWVKLGISKERGTEQISSSFLEGYLACYGVKNVKNIATGNRAQIIRDLGAYTRQYVNSESFRQQYFQRRESAKPQQPRPAKSLEEVRAEYKETMLKSIRSMEEFTKNSNADLKKMAAEHLPALRKQLKDIEDPKNQLIKMMAEGEKMAYDNSLKNYQNEMKRWEAAYPADPRTLIKNRLYRMLELTADVDFDAQVKERSGKKVFVNPAYENKPDEWKMAYRAGKEAVSAARIFAQEWIKELN